ncbi:glutaminyl-peptide cyclotransferase [Synoicihabitans lomoniglobus]|uniref:Glutaminyl-peptide cyclotransferase n=1 Tax=Synoicihabitans lomoniglobus TaxID=2909285 RepID=A0AAF0I3Y3_9BACT|nr:glutaminyl-peptide cyclotransferase [Opitutaceae bacterium LMO-M01]WED66434.1 glutaminyl-peptide cyclotransferase [Opitutaceae bacterium LMO-M01]
MPTFTSHLIIARWRLGIALWCGALAAGSTSAAEAEENAPPAEPTRYGFEIVHRWPHDPEAFTQGLLFHDGMLLESTGMNGHSSLRRVDLTTGKVRQRVEVNPLFFAEGLTVIGTKAYQLTWRSRTGFIYDVDSLELVDQFPYPTEGWGLTTDGESLIMSDGSNSIHFLDAHSFAHQRTVEVVFNGQPVHRLNELEYIGGEIYANIWQTHHIVRIDPKDGRITGIIDLTGLEPTDDRRHRADVLNGIAYDEAGDRLFVTGKYWSELFEIRLVPQT